jgi:membrane-associated phospholipid phosphatase
MMAGGHFPSDTIYAGVFTFLTIWLCYAAIYRWPRTRLSDESIDNALTRIGMPGYKFIAGMFRKKKTEL